MSVRQVRNVQPVAIVLCDRQKMELTDRSVPSVTLTSALGAGELVHESLRKASVQKEGALTENSTSAQLLVYLSPSMSLSERISTVSEVYRVVAEIEPLFDVRVMLDDLAPSCTDDAQRDVARRLTQPQREKEVESMRTFPTVCVGGTFDHMHAGHRLLLTVSAIVAEKALLVGVSGDKLLQRKAYRDRLEPFATRCRAVRQLIETIRPSLKLDIVELQDVSGPVVTRSDIDAIVVTPETAPNAEQINRERLTAGLESLEIIQTVLLYSGNENQKISSTQFRRNETSKT